MPLVHIVWVPIKNKNINFLFVGSFISVTGNTTNSYRRPPCDAICFINSSTPAENTNSKQLHSITLKRF